MTRFGYTLMTEQSGPRELVWYAQAADRAGFDFVASSDHYSPWLAEQGHSPNAWPVLGAVAQATRDVELMTFVTCPTMRYHPAVVAQKAATVAVLSDGRFQLNLGAGENLNEHVVGQRWPAIGERHDMLEEALGIIRKLLRGERLTVEGTHFRVDSATVWDLPESPIAIGIAVSGQQSISRFAPVADHMVGTHPDKEAVDAWAGIRDSEGLPVSRVFGQIPICWDRDRDTAVQRAHEQLRWFVNGWTVNSDLSTPDAFAAVSAFVRPEDIAAKLPCGPDLDEIVEAVSAFWDAGYTDIALLQVGDQQQQEFLDVAVGPLLEKLRAAAPAAAPVP